MKRLLLAGSLAAVLGFLVLAAYAAEPPANAASAQAPAARPMTCCPMCPMGRMAAPAAPNAPASAQGAMTAMGMPGPMMMQCRMMMMAQTDARDPGSLLGLKDDLKLTDEQAAKLAAIAEKARADAAAVLTVEQKDKVKALADAPRTMMEMCQRMMLQMQGTTKDTQGPMMMCPMMRMMMGQGKTGGAEPPK